MIKSYFVTSLAIILVGTFACFWAYSHFEALHQQQPGLQMVTPLAQPTQTGTVLERSLVAHEVERREGSKVNPSDVHLTGPGAASVTLPSGTPTLQFGYREPMRDCNINATHAQYEKCVEATQANPLGFTVQSYAVQPAQ